MNTHFPTMNPFIYEDPTSRRGILKKGSDICSHLKGISPIFPLNTTVIRFYIDF